ncbi:Alpha/Beta hydrolase protein [Pavlovales sp. CCMP2436]|nr:Alpha/Beta hydrolase protein [Pavlovales sp. CCMP2436]|mmetsp:Transcript_33918/g.84411  ORF Transcript_33918/g.84411 Transcript_33918/m.84411 type:complete len:401 (+) Transcript_33918:33-1235(+)
MNFFDRGASTAGTAGRRAAPIAGRRALAVLAHRWATPAPTPEAPATRLLLCLHGVLGSKANWSTPAKLLVKAAETAGAGGWHALCLDHRAHADSPAASPPHTVDACAMDVEQTLEAFESSGLLRLAPGITGVPLVVVGHSFGGKVALALARRRCERGLPPAQQTWLIDSNPGPLASATFDAAYARALADAAEAAGESGREPDSAVECAAELAAEAAEAEAGRAELNVAFVLAAVERAVADAPSDPASSAGSAGSEDGAVFSSRAEFESVLGRQGLPKALAQWLAQSARPASPGGSAAGPVRLGHDLSVILDLLRSYRRTDLWHVLEDRAAQGQGAPPAVGVIVGGLNRGAWGEAALARLDAAAASSGGRVRVCVLETAGHNVHVDDLVRLLEEVAPTLRA